MLKIVGVWKMSQTYCIAVFYFSMLSFTTISILKREIKIAQPKCKLLLVCSAMQKGRRWSHIKKFTHNQTHMKLRQYKCNYKGLQNTVFLYS
jgi:hypothetical protein